MIDAIQLTFTAPLTNIRLLIRFILSTSCKVLVLSPNKRIWSPGTTFQYFILSRGRTDLITGSRRVERLNHCLGMGRRCRKSVVHGLVVAAPSS
jgi:hypothetical protein